MLGDLLVGAALELMQHQRLALLAGKGQDVVHEHIELSPARDLLGGAKHKFTRGSIVHERLGWAAPADRIQAAVASNLVEPGTAVDGAVVGPNGFVGGGKRVLENVLGVLAGAQYAPAEGEELALVTGDQDREGVVVTGPQPRNQMLIRAVPE